MTDVQEKLIALELHPGLGLQVQNERDEKELN